VKRHAKASTAGSNSGTGSSRGALRRAFAIRGASSDADGTGAPSATRIVLAMCAAVLLAGALAAPAQAATRAKVGQIPAVGGAGAGALLEPRELAANRTGAGGVSAGDVYVLDNNNRVSQFSATGTFVRAFGFDVVESGQDNTVANEFEICQAVSSPTDVCKAGSAVGQAGGLAGAQGIAVDQTTGNVYVYEITNSRVEIFSAKGSFQGAFGWKVKAGGEAAAALQFCTTAGTGCQAGEGTASAGGFGTSGIAGPRNLSIDSSGKLYVPDSGNLRIDVYQPALNGSNEVTGVTFVRAIGYDVIPSGAEGSGDLNSTTTVSGVATTKKAFLVGQAIAGAGIAPGTTITAVAATSLTLSQAATATATGVALTVAEGAGNVAQNEKQTVTLPAATGGTFTLTFTAPNPQVGTNPLAATAIPYNATPAEVEAKLAALANIGAGNVSVTSSNPGGGVGISGGPYTVEFKGTRYADTNVAQLTASGAGLTPSGVVSIATVQEGAALEVCTVASACKKGSAGLGAGQFRAENPTTAAVDASGNIYAVSNSTGGTCSTTAPCRVQKFNPDGTVANANFGPATGECATTIAPVVTPPNANTSGPNGKGAQTVAVDPVTGHVLVLQRILGSAEKVCELDATTGALISISPPGSMTLGTAAAAGLAVGTPQEPGAEPRVYVANGFSPVYILGPVPAPGVEILPVTEVAQTTAKLNGKVTIPSPGGEGFDTVYHFEISADGGGTWAKVPTSDVSVGSTAGTFEVNQTATGLQPNKVYLVRLVATTGPSAISTSVQFKTKPAPPAVTEDPAVISVTSTSGTLSGTVNPDNSPTTYRFEYGTTTSYGTQSPAEFEPFVGSGGDPVPVTAHLSGLEPNTTYHWRIVATNSVDKTVGPDQQFTTYEEPEALNRAVELVTPPDKRPVGVVKPFIINSQIHFQVAENGEGIGYPVLNGLGDTTSGGDTMYAAKRSETAGWASSEVSAPALLSSADVAPAPSRVRYFSPADLKCALVQSFQPLTADTPAVDIANGVTNLYRWNAADRTYTLITDKIPLNPAADSFPYQYQVVGASGDCSRIFFQSETYSFIAGASGVYEWDDGILRDVLPPAAEGLDLNLFDSRENTVSPEGRFFFTAKSKAPGDSEKQAIFVRKSPTETVDASLPTPGKGATNGANYETASPDGSHVFFLANYGIASTSSTGPTSGACSGKSENNGEWSTTPCDLYDYNVQTGLLTDVSADTANPADTNGAVVQGVMDVSEDGSVVYFAALGQLVPGKGRTYAQNQEATKYANVYRYKSGTPLTYVGSLTSQDLKRNAADRKGGALIHNPRNWTSQANDVGSYFLFVSHDNMTGTNPAEVEEAYLFSAATGAAECVSCPRDGSAPHAAGSGVLRTPEELQARVVQPNSLSEDGRVVFTVEDALTPDAVEGHGAGANPETEIFENNIYEWHQGQISLLATGQAQALGMGGPAGRDVFLRTTARLAPQDFDLGYDIYDLRSGGGFPAPPPPPVPCDVASSACQGAETPQPAGLSPASQSSSGEGNPPLQAPPCPKGKVRRQGKCVPKSRHKAHHKRHSRAANTNRGGAK
jgi:hypothetical protein